MKFLLQNRLFGKLYERLNNIAKQGFKYYFVWQNASILDNYIRFHGKVFLIVNRQVYSASESFASFCKNSKWATVVGEKTGGDGIGLSPVIVALPNTGFLVNSTWVLGADASGEVNEEVKTTPDIIVDPTIGKNFNEDKSIQAILSRIKAESKVQSKK